MEQRNVNYYVIAPCRNEKAAIKPFIKSLLNQTIKPLKIFIVNDGSKDGTVNIIDAMNVDRVKIVNVNLPRYSIKGLNISRAIFIGFNRALSEGAPEFFLKADVDCTLPSNYVEKILPYLSGKVGVVSGFSKKIGYHHHSIPDIARIYRRECLLDVFSRSPHNGYPVIYGHDTFILLRLEWLGWSFRSLKIPINDIRGYKRSRIGWIYQGRLRYQNGFTLLAQLKHFTRQIQAGENPIGAFSSLISYLLSHLFDERKLEPEYYKFIRKRYS